MWKEPCSRGTSSAHWVGEVQLSGEGKNISRLDSCRSWSGLGLGLGLEFGLRLG